MGVAFIFKGSIVFSCIYFGFEAIVGCAQEVFLTVLGESRLAVLEGLIIQMPGLDLVHAWPVLYFLYSLKLPWRDF